MKILSFDLKLIGLIFIVLLFFASNSILARMAIFTQNIDAFSFTFLRIISAMVILLFIYFYKNKKIKIDFKNNYISGFMFFLYAICFSYSYINMAAGIGTLILFAVVQLTMIILALFLNEKLTLKKIFGIAIAFEEDQKFVGKLFLKYVAENEDFHERLEELELSWADDFHISNSMIQKTIGFMKQNQPSHTLIKMLKDEEDRHFAKKLFLLSWFRLR